jgi:ATP-dependent DNA helicase RecG
MPHPFFMTAIEYLKGVGPQRGELLKKELGVYTYWDMIQHYPFRYVDRTRFYKVNEINQDMPYIQLKGRIRKIDTIGQKRAQRLIAYFQDETGELELVWFQGAKWVRDSLKTGVKYCVFGKPSFYKGQASIVHPELELVSDQLPGTNSALQPIYNSTEKLKTRGLDSKGIAKIQKAILGLLPSIVPENLPDSLISDLRLLSHREALLQIHIPANNDLLRKAEFRLKFEELFFIQIQILNLKVQRIAHTHGHPLTIIGEKFNSFYKEKLPFELTNAQKKVLKEIRMDTATGKQMNRMLQGDVGSGKTLVALMTMLMAIDNNLQACIMAPTEILACQHYESITRLVAGMDIKVGLLTGSTKKKDRAVLHEALLDGSMHILIGTHALIEDIVQFKALGMVVIDEQHRFGVEQRARLWKKNVIPPHVLVMTATPIPRTLAMTLYGDLDISIIDELPPGRKPITTSHRYDSSRLRVFGFMKEQITLGRQIYVVYPLIKESETMDYKDLMDGFESISRAFPLPEYKISIVHGKMKASEKEYEMQRFIKGETQIMVATTVIEVGVNVPNASVMVIESAERFGLSQLHQLRGRVGRGADQSFCILLSSFKLSAEAKVRLETMVRTNDGFEIADIDMQLRGPGDLAGTQQSGLMELHIANLSKDKPILDLARKAAQNILEKDPHMSTTANRPVVEFLKNKKRDATNWSKIS